MKKQTEAIKFLEKIFGIKLSTDQKRIVKYNFKSPVLINACAGSGKTTLLLFNIYVAIAENICGPQNILGITFSKDAQQDMTKRFARILHHIQRLGINTPSLSLNYPTFSTFHALFYHILEEFPQFQGTRVITDYSDIGLPIYRAIEVQSKALPQNLLVQSIFRLRSNLINKGYSLDGYYLNGYQTNPKELMDFSAEHLGIRHDINYFVDYLSVVREYCLYKKANHEIDFNDMEVLLLRLTKTKSCLHKIKKIMSRYQLCFLDEFQDINALQWKLMKTILSKKALSRLVVIGDDDQSIYGFRGSKPQIIINYTKNFPKARQFNLSTNYRTCSRALKMVKPLIIRNQYRMPKQLRTTRKNKGFIKEYLSRNTDYSSSLLLLRKILKAIKNPKIKNNDIAVLVRYNSDRLIAIDYLANHGIYIKSDNFLQKPNGDSQLNRIYRIFMNMINALASNDFGCFYKCASIIGFNQYKRNHVSQILATVQGHHIGHLSTYLLIARQYNIHHNLVNTKFGRYDKSVSAALDNCRLDKHHNISASYVFNYVINLTQNYFKFMAKNQFMSRNVIKDLTRYFKQRISKYKSVYKFLGNEVTKRKFLVASSRNQLYKGAHIITIHESKGLQFKHVFLYNFTDREVNSAMMAEDYQFGPQISSKQFLNKVLSFRLKSNIFANLNGAEDPSMLKGMISHNKAKMPYYRFRVRYIKYLQKVNKDIRQQYKNKKQKLNPDQAKHLQNKIIQNTKTKLLKNVLNRTEIGSNLQLTFNDLFIQAKADCVKVEEERRLIYVACTRAIDSVSFNLSAKSNPLMYELQVPKQDIYFMGKDKKFHKTKFNNIDKQTVHKLNKKVDKQTKLNL